MDEIPPVLHYTASAKEFFGILERSRDCKDEIRQLVANSLNDRRSKAALDYSRFPCSLLDPLLR